MIAWPFLFPEQQCPRCLMPVHQFDCIEVYEIEQGTMREYPRWAHPREICRENLA